MVGRGSRKDDLPSLSSTNGFAALESLKKKKKSDNRKSKGLSKNQAKEPEQPVFWAPTPITSKKWADVEDEDDDDYYATTAPLNESLGLPVQQQTKEDDELEEETESEDDDGDDDVEDEVENEPKVPVPVETGLKKPTLAASATKGAERQLSKKERKKKEDEELAAILAELGISSKDNNAGQDGRSNSVTSKKIDEQNGETEKKDNAPAASESKISKKKKAKKDKTSREVKDLQEQPNGGDTNTPDEVSGTQPTDKDAPAVDVKERIKKVAPMRKKKSSKEMDPAAKAAAQEAATRNARVATSKRKDKNHYNQQPIR
ncbi:hypothetical protein DsansV1_C35g0228711 [Dioscorea sansibarensis]